MLISIFLYFILIKLAFNFMLIYYNLLFNIVDRIFIYLLEI